MIPPKRYPVDEIGDRLAGLAIETNPSLLQGNEFSRNLLLWDGDESPLGGQNS